MRRKRQKPWGEFLSLMAALYLILTVLRGVEIFALGSRDMLKSGGLALFLDGLFPDWLAVAGSGLLFLPFYFLLWRKGSRIAAGSAVFYFGFLTMISALLSFYFVGTLEALDERILLFSFSDIQFIMGHENIPVNVWSGLAALVVSSLVFGLLYAGIRRLKSERVSGTWLLIGFFVVPPLFGWALFRGYPAPLQFPSETEFQQANNKELYFLSRTMGSGSDDPRYTAAELEAAIRTYQDSQPCRDFIDADFPLIHRTDAPNVLGPYFREDSIRPNIVLLICEGLARPYSGPDAKLGSFTPFLDSLAQVGLYWENFLGCSDRTYGALPNVFASMPIGGKRGVLSLGHAMPDFYSLYDLTREHGYSSGFNYGGWLGFDGMGRFILKNDVQVVTEESKFPTEARVGNWGVPDHILFDSSFRRLADQDEPYINGFLTLTLHSPYKVPQSLGPYPNPPAEGIAARFADAMQCARYSDRALSRFLKSYQNRPEYERTIFIITGDHCIEMLDKYTANPLDVFHVPLIIYSPLMNRSGNFRGVSTHRDITPSLAALLEGNFQMDRPKANPWIGIGLDTSRTFRSVQSLPLGRISGKHDTYLEGEDLLFRGDLFRVGPCFDLFAIENAERKEQIADQLGAYLIVNSFTCRKNRLWFKPFSGD